MLTVKGYGVGVKGYGLGLKVMGLVYGLRGCVGVKGEGLKIWAGLKVKG